jgi:SET domain-containing protein
MLVKRAAVGRSTIHGWGLIAKEPIPAGEIADESPVLVTGERVPHAFEAHVYQLADGRSAFPCGDGIFTNHCGEPNAAPKVDLRRRIMVLVALRDIEPGEEITIDYDGSVTSARSAHSETRHVTPRPERSHKARRGGRR